MRLDGAREGTAPACRRPGEGIHEARGLVLPTVVVGSCTARVATAAVEVNIPPTRLGRPTCSNLVDPFALLTGSEVIPRRE